MSSPCDTSTPVQPGVLRKTLGLIAFALLLIVALWRANVYLNDPDVRRPRDFLQVWSAGRLILAGENPYDAKKLLDLQLANQSPILFASMMWVPPWVAPLAILIGLLPVAYAHAAWVLGQVVLIFLAGMIVWRLRGRRLDRWWIIAVLILTSGPVWWQTVIGQYAGILVFGIAAYLWAHQANRPVLAGLCLTLIALKPHLFVLFAVGLLIDAVKTSYGRRVVLGGAIGLATCSLIATLASPGIWNRYLISLTGEGSAYTPGLREWFSPTIPAWIRFSIPGHPFWVQTIPCVIATIAFAVYWWRRGNPNRWPETINWVIPVCLLLAPYGCWPSDLTLMLIPIVGMVTRIDARGWVLPGRAKLATVYLAINLLVMVMFLKYSGTAAYVWVAPALCGCLLWARASLNHPELKRSQPVESGSQSFSLQPQPTA